MLGEVFSKEAAEIAVCNFDTELKGSLFELKGSGEDGRLTEKEYELVRPMLMYVVNDISDLIKRFDLELPKAFFRSEEDLKRFLRLSQDRKEKPL